MKNMHKATSILILALLFAVPFSLRADESHLYDFLWLDPDKSVFVLQNKVYKKKGKTYVNMGYISGLSGDYQNTSGGHLSVGHYLNEEWAIELMYNKYSSSDNDSFKSLQSINSSIPFVRKQRNTYGALAVWSPFYGKINTFNKIIYFDWSFGLGLGQTITESNANTVANPTTADIYHEEKNMAYLMKTGVRIHINKSFHVNIDYWRNSFKAPGPRVNGNQDSSLRANSDLILSIGISF